MSTFIRKELMGDVKVNITERPLDAVSLARAIATAKTIKDKDDAFMVVSLDAVLDRFHLWKRELPHIEPFYAVKCNSDEILLRALAALGAGFDCASREEIDTVIRIGVAPERIIYANPCKTRSFILHAEEKEVKRMTFDNGEELHKITSCHRNPELILRIAVSDPTASCQLNLKFGAEPVKAAPALLRKASELGVNVCGVSFHVGSGCNDPSAYRNALQHTRNLFNYGRSMGHRMEIVDLGGGFPGAEHHIQFEDIASVIRSAVNEFFPDPDVRLIAEPGRYFACRPFTLVANIIARTAVPAEKITKKIEDASSVGHMYYINDGVYGSFNCITFDHAHPVGLPLFESDDAELFPTTIWGPTCDAIDKIEDQKWMRLMEVGDWILYTEMGAYTCAASSTFNGFARPTPVYVMGERTWRRLGL